MAMAGERMAGTQDAWGRTLEGRVTGRVSLLKGHSCGWWQSSAGADGALVCCSGQRLACWQACHGEARLQRGSILFPAQVCRGRFPCGAQWHLEPGFRMA